MNYSIDWDGPGERDREPNWRGLPGLWQAIVDHTQGELFWIGELLLSELEKETGFRGAPSITGGPDAVRMEFVDRISGTVDPGPPQAPEGYRLVPIVGEEDECDKITVVDTGDELHQVLGEALARACTCHPDDNPPRPCPQKFALTECRAAAKLTSQQRAGEKS